MLDVILLIIVLHFCDKLFLNINLYDINSLQIVCDHFYIDFK